MENLSIYDFTALVVASASIGFVVGVSGVLLVIYFVLDSFPIKDGVEDIED